MDSSSAISIATLVVAAITAIAGVILGIRFSSKCCGEKGCSCTSKPSKPSTPSSSDNSTRESTPERNATEVAAATV